MWAYGIQLWGTVSNMEMLERFQNRYLRIIQRTLVRHE